MSKGVNIDFPTHLKISNVWSILYTTIVITLAIAGFYHGVIKDQTKTDERVSALIQQVKDQQVVIDKYREEIPVLQDRVSGMNRTLGVATQSSQIRYR